MPFDSISNNYHLVHGINNLFICFYFNDTKKPGKDDTLRDYIYISNIADIYLISCIKVALQDAREVRGNYSIIAMTEYDSNGIARYPRKGYYFIDDVSYYKLWLLSKILPFYNEDEHKQVIKNNPLKAAISRIKNEIETTITHTDKPGHIEATARYANKLDASKSYDYSILVIDTIPKPNVIERFFELHHIEENLNITTLI